MRLAAILGVAALCFVGAALAQTDLVPAEPFAAQYETRATGQDYARLYPRDAMNSGTSGIAVLCCRPASDRTLHCVHAVEWPAGANFGAASQEIGRRFRITQESYDAFNANPHNWIRQTIVWRMGSRPNPQLEETRRVFAEEGTGLCRPDPVYAPDAEQAPAPETAPQE